MSSDHLPLETLNALADGELSPLADSEAQTHLNECHACSRRALEAYQLRAAVKKAALRSVPSAEVLARLTAAASRPVRKQRVHWFSLRMLAAPAAAVLILAAVVFAGWKWTRESDSFLSEVLDQHLATLSEASQPEVISSDRHTVKPWFEGKLPFSFNLPEANTLPPDTALTGADLAYIEGRPAAVLLFTIHKHRTSVFVSQASLITGLPRPQARAGFQFVETRAGGLAFLGVSDTNAGELGALVQRLASVQ